MGSGPERTERQAALSASASDDDAGLAVRGLAMQGLAVRDRAGRALGQVCDQDRDGAYIVVETGVVRVVRRRVPTAAIAAIDADGVLLEDLGERPGDDVDASGAAQVG